MSRASAFHIWKQLMKILNHILPCKKSDWMVFHNVNKRINYKIIQFGWKLPACYQYLYVILDNYKLVPMLSNVFLLHWENNVL